MIILAGVVIISVNNTGVLKSADFLKVLNDEVKLNDGWAYWIAGEDGYPVLDFSNINKVVTEPSEQ